MANPDAIRALCEAEIALLEEGYPKATIGKVYLPMYRKAIKLAVAEGKLPMNDATSRRYTYVKRESGEAGEAHDHRSLDWLKYDNATYTTIAAGSAQRNNAKQDNLKPVNPDAYLTKAAELLQSSDPFELAVGIAAVTGRRFSEVIDKGVIEATDHSYWVNFSGQLKKKADAGSYLTPCLVPAEAVLDAIDRFRQHPRIARVAGGTAKDINRSLSNSIKRSVQRHFGETNIIPVLEGEAAVTIHNLRGVYGEISVHFFCPPARGMARFIQERLGHVISDEELKRSNATATQHYFHYYLIDGDGKHIGSKGVMLIEDEPLPTPIDSTSKSLPEVQPISTGTDNEAMPGAIDSLNQQVQSLSDEIQRIWSHIEKMNAPSQQVPTTTDTTFFTREIETLRSQLTAIELERDQAAATVQQFKAENEALLLRLTQERLAFQHRIEGLTDLLRQAPPIVQPAIVKDQPEVTEHSAPAMTTAATAIERPKPLQPQPATPLPPVQPQPRREHITRAGSADQKVEAAMLAVMAWNRQQLSDSSRFAITQNLLQKTTGSNMPAVKRVMSDFQNQIHEHNAEYGLDPDRHNYRKDLQPIENWVKQKI